MEEEFKHFFFKVFDFFIAGLAATEIEFTVNVFPLIGESRNQRHRIPFIKSMATAQHNIFLSLFHKPGCSHVILPADTQGVMPVNGPHSAFIPNIVTAIVNGEDCRCLFPVCQALEQAESRGQNGSVRNALGLGKGIHCRQINMQGHRFINGFIFFFRIQIPGQFPGPFRKGTDKILIPLLFFLILRCAYNVLYVVIIIKDTILFRLQCFT